MKVKGIVIGSVVAGLAFGAILPATAASSFVVDTVCEIDFLELRAQELAKVPENQRTSYFAPGPANKGDFAFRKCTQSRSHQTQMLSCRRLIKGWENPVAFQTNKFENKCQMVSCDNPDEFVEADVQHLKVRVRGPDTVEVFLFCQRHRRK